MSATAQTSIAGCIREARFQAGYKSRGSATTTIPYSPETIGRHERGEIEIDAKAVAVYAKNYQQPALLMRYCSDCPIGEMLKQELEDRDFLLASVRLNYEIKAATEVMPALERIMYDGKYSDERERVEVIGVIKSGEAFVKAFEEFKLWAFSSGHFTPEDIMRGA